MRIWQQKGLEDEIKLLMQYLREKQDERKQAVLFTLNQYCKAKVQNAFFTWLTNCSTKITYVESAS